MFILLNYTLLGNQCYPKLKNNSLGGIVLSFLYQFIILDITQLLHLVLFQHILYNHCFLLYHLLASFQQEKVFHYNCSIFDMYLYLIHSLYILFILPILKKTLFLIFFVHHLMGLCMVYQ